MHDNQGSDVNDARPSALGHLVGMRGIIGRVLSVLHA